MKYFKKLRKHPNFWPLVIVIFFAILAGRSLIFQSGYFNMHDDLQMMRQLEMEKCFLDGQIPCRWVPDMGYGFGFPLFNFYPPLPYLIGEAIRVLGASFVVTAKLTFALSFVVSGIGMYLLAKDFFGRLGGVLASIFYVWAPYHAVDVYVRGAMNEAWALAWFPFIFWTGYRLIKEKKKQTKWIIGLALAWFALLTSHNLMVLMFAPVFVGWLLLHLWREKAWTKIPHLAFSGILAFGLAAFFTLPALLENKFTQIESVLVGYYDFTAHFVSINQLLVSRFWGYGGSAWGLINDKMSFQVGHFHWILSLIIGLLIFLKLFNKKKNLLEEIKKNKPILFVSFLFLVGWLSTFMAHPRSTSIWLAIPQLRLIQFPWRFLAITIFAFSFISGAIVIILPKKLTKIVLAALVLGLLFFNWNYFKPEQGRMGPLTDKDKFSEAAWELQQAGGIYDYLPRTAEMAPTEPQKHLAEILEGEGEIIDPKQGTNWAEFNVKIDSDEAMVRIGIFQFPDWQVFMDGDQIETKVPEEEKWGRMWIEIPRGEHKITARFYNTPIRTVANTISLFSWGILLTFPIWRKKLS
jgi:hypothetical protein